MLLQYAAVKSSTPALDPLLRRPHFKSQNGEEYYLLEIFRRIGVDSQTYVEIGAADGVWLSNTAYFRDQLGWTGFGFEGSREKLDALGETICQQRNLHHAWVTSQNVNDLFRQHSVPATVDLFSLDIDGDDYWVWKALTWCQPRVVIIETNPGIPNEVPLTIKEGQTGCIPKEWQGYFGANLRCMIRLAHEKGYGLATVVNFNAVFVRRDVYPLLGVKELSEDEAVATYFCPRSYWFKHKDQKNREWVNPYDT